MPPGISCRRNYAESSLAMSQDRAQLQEFELGACLLGLPRGERMRVRERRGRLFFLRPPSRFSAGGPRAFDSRASQPASPSTVTGRMPADRRPALCTGRSALHRCHRSSAVLGQPAQGPPWPLRTLSPARKQRAFASSAHLLTRLPRRTQLESHSGPTQLGLAAAAANLLLVGVFFSTEEGDAPACDSAAAGAGSRGPGSGVGIDQFEQRGAEVDRLTDPVFN